MPTYSYKCTECGNAFDAQQAFTDDSLTTCPVCGGTLRKVFNTIGVTFNGSGFYRTDSRASTSHSEPPSRPATKEAAAAGSSSAPAAKPAATSQSSTGSTSSTSSSGNTSPSGK